MRVALFSSLSKKTGCWLKLGYLASALKEANVDVVVYDPLPPMPLFLDFILSIPWNTMRALFCRCDVLFGAKPFLHVTFPFLLCKWLKGTWAVVDVDDLDYEYRTGILRRIVYGMQTALTRFMDMVTYHNATLVEPLHTAFKVSPTKLYCLRQGVDFHVFDYGRLNDPVAIGKLRARYGLSDRDEVIVYSAHLNAASCLDGVLKTIQRVRTQKANVKLLVIGGGDRERHYRQLAEQLGLSASVIFTGYLTPAEVAGHILLGEIALVYYDDSPANLYRCSMKLRELLGMARVVVCNRTGEAAAFSDYLELAESDWDSMADAIWTAIANKETLRQKAERGRLFIQDRYNWRSIGAAFLDELRLRRNLPSGKTPEEIRP
jgi:glycosyltransferase involved in cell wall biosynthesis